MENLILTTCILCGLPLSHPTSVEIGIGPICRRKASIEENLTPVVVNAANAILARIMATSVDMESLQSLVKLGLPNLALAVAKKFALVIFSRHEGLLRMSSKYDPALVSLFRSLPGRRWDPAHKVWTVPETNIDDVCSRLKAQYHGRLCVAEGEGFFALV